MLPEKNSGIHSTSLGEAEKLSGFGVDLNKLGVKSGPNPFLKYLSRPFLNSPNI